MKKILVLLLLLFNFFNFSFAYQVTFKQQKILNKIFFVIDKSDEKQILKLEKILQKFLNNNKINEKKRLIFTKINNYILVKKLSKNQSKSKKKFYKNKFKVLKVIDGDTIIINYFGKKENIRLIGIDAPENSKIRKGFIECYGKESKEFLQKILKNKEIFLEFDKTQGKKDKYDRLLAYIFLGKININNLLIKKGFVKEYTYNKPYKYQELLKNSQKEAKKNNIGIWNINICNYKIEKIQQIKIKLKNNFCDIKGNISYKTHKKIYHFKNCPGYKKTKINLDRGEKWFCSEKEAIEAGWRKAKNCKNVSSHFKSDHFNYLKC